MPPDTQVLFLLSVPNSLKSALLRSSRLLVYTPTNEHFGIVPLEAMLARLPVLAANTGGPVETIADPETGWLRDPDDPDAWSAVMRSSLAMSDEEAARMGDAGAARVKALFGRDKMAQTLEETIDEIVAMKSFAAPALLNGIINFVALASFVALSAVAAALVVRLFGWTS